jgi:4-hydroxy-tetrahydrodipicolinate reductase
LHRKKWRFHLSSNFSLGVNIFFEINEYLAKMMAKLDHYSIEMEEIHHTQKLDAPSGTAISLKGVIENSKYTVGPRQNQLRIKFILKQKLQLFLEHKVTYNSSVDSISIEHTAHNREGFALIIAAEWIVGKQGTFTMKDVLELK